MEAFRILFIIKVSLSVTECRVFCQDAHASPWIPLGYSCPVNCENIINAIEKLKMLDYRQMIESDRAKKAKLSSSYINRVINSLSAESAESEKPVTNEYRTKYYYKHKADTLLRDQRYIAEAKDVEHGKYENPSVEYQNIYDNEIEAFKAKQDSVMYYEYENLQPLHNEEYRQNGTGQREGDSVAKKKETTSTTLAGIGDRLEMELRSVFGNTTCDWSDGGRTVLLRKLMRRCHVGRRNDYSPDFLRTITNTINRYSEASFELNEDMVKLIMERVFGTGTRTTGDLFDLSKLLRFLRSAVEKHRLHRRKEATIVLKPRHCLSLSLPGCFCRPGFVEKSGQCVRPNDCDMEPSNVVYLTRIIVH